MKNTSACIASFIGGMILGAAITALTTPRTGKEVRDSIRDFVDKETDKLREKTDALRNKVDQLRAKMADKIEELDEECNCGQ